LQVQAESRIKQYEEQLLANDDYKEKFSKEKKVIYIMRISFFSLACGFFVWSVRNVID